MREVGRSGSLVPSSSSPALPRLAWYNRPYWIGRTLAEDWVRRRRGPRRPRPPSLRHLLRPALRRPIFVIGAPRSGTTFLGDCLAALPEVSYHHEPVATKAAVRYVYEERWNPATAARFFRRTYRWLLRWRAAGDARFAEKTPRSCFIVAFLSQAFHDAQFIHIIRDGRDSAASHRQQPWLLAASRASGRRDPAGHPYGPYAQYWVEPDRAAEFEATSDIHRCAWAWRRYTEAALTDSARLPAERCHQLHYETLVTEPSGSADRILDFLGIVDPRSRQAFADAVGAASTRSVGRWRHTLTADEIAEVEAEAGALLTQLGYELSEAHP